MTKTDEHICNIQSHDSHIIQIIGCLLKYLYSGEGQAKLGLLEDWGMKQNIPENIRHVVGSHVAPAPSQEHHCSIPLSSRHLLLSLLCDVASEGSTYSLCSLKCQGSSTVETSLPLSPVFPLLTFLPSGASLQKTSLKEVSSGHISEGIWTVCQVLGVYNQLAFDFDVLKGIHGCVDLCPTVEQCLEQR